MDKVLSGLEKLLKTPEQKEANKAAEAILTLDTKTKTVHNQDGELIVAGFAKGAGMIAPNMATMLGFLVTNADISSKALRRELQAAVAKSFNMISVDTDTSTNDLVIVLSTGEVQIEDKPEVFSSMLEQSCTSLAQQIAADGEGAEKLIEVRVEGGQSLEDAELVAKNVVNSPLVKTAVHGADPNWGRIMMAVGKNPSVRFTPTRVDVTLAGQLVFAQGEPTEFDRPALSERLKADTVEIIRTAQQR